MAAVPREHNNWWFNHFVEGTYSFEVVEILKKEQRAFTADELGRKVKERIKCEHDVRSKNISWALMKLRERRLLKRSRERIRTGNGFNNYLYGLEWEHIERRAMEIFDLSRNDPTFYTLKDSELSLKVIDIFYKLDEGLTPQQIVQKLNLDPEKYQVVNQQCRRLFEKGVITKCPFPFPTRIKGVTNIKTYIYGRNKEIVLKGLLKLMPESVKKSLKLIKYNTKVFSSYELKARTDISSLDLIQWFQNCFYNLNLVNHKIIGCASYYYNPELNPEVIDKQLEDQQELRRKHLYNITSLGKLFEQKAIYTFVKYKQACGEEIKIADGFPEKIPNWLSKEVRDNHKQTVIDENHEEKMEWTNDVWKFDREPVDFIVFSRDHVTKTKNVYIITVKRNTSNQYGVGYFSSFVGCCNLGRTKRGVAIPYFQQAKPVFVCAQTFGQNIYRFNSHLHGDAGQIITMKIMNDMIKAKGIQFDKDYEFNHALEASKAYDAYLNHEDVILGNKSIEQIMREKGFAEQIVLESGARC